MAIQTTQKHRIQNTASTNAIPTMAGAEAKRSWLFLAGAALLVAVLLAYANHWSNGFHFDDVHTVQNNAYIQSLGNVPSFYANTQTFSSLPGHGSYRPVVSTTLAFDYWMAQTFTGD